eukprot:3261339-Prymnesium_polylepis.1
MRVACPLRPWPAKEDVERLDVVVDVARLVQLPQAVDHVAADLQHGCSALLGAQPVRAKQDAPDRPAEQVHDEHIARPAEDRLARVVVQHGKAFQARHRAHHLRLEREPRLLVRRRAVGHHLDRDLANVVAVAPEDFAELPLAQHIRLVDPLQRWEARAHTGPSEAAGGATGVVGCSTGKQATA